MKEYVSGFGVFRYFAIVMHLILRLVIQSFLRLNARVIRHFSIYQLHTFVVIAGKAQSPRSLKRW